jgi:hypothetical protein
VVLPDEPPVSGTSLAARVRPVPGLLPSGLGILDPGPEVLISVSRLPRSASKRRSRARPTASSPSSSACSSVRPNPTLLAETPEGYANLCRLLTRAHMQAVDRRNPLLPFPALLDPDRVRGLVLLTGCRRSPLWAALQNGVSTGEALAAASPWALPDGTPGSPRPPPTPAACTARTPALPCFRHGRIFYSIRRRYASALQVGGLLRDRPPAHRNRRRHSPAYGRLHSQNPRPTLPLRPRRASAIPILQVQAWLVVCRRSSR